MLPSLSLAIKPGSKIILFLFLLRNETVFFSLRKSSTTSRSLIFFLKISSRVSLKIISHPFCLRILKIILLDKISPKRLIFSSYGIREGKFFEMVPRELMDQDPLISACEYYGFQAGRFSVARDEVFSWVKVIFKDIDPREIRLIEAACLLGDIGWPEHPDYRAMHSFTRVLRLPIAGITHRERVLLALSIYHRYGGDEYGPEITITTKLIDQKDRDLALILG